MKAVAVVSLDLPIRIQVPDDNPFVIHLPDGPCQLRVTERPAPAREDGMRAEGFDDGKGTYVRSTVAARFELDITDTLPLSRDAADELSSVMRRTAWGALQAFLRAYAYISRHLESLFILEPESYKLELINPSSGRSVDGFPLTSGHVLPGPIALKANLTNEGLAKLNMLLQPDVNVPLPDEILLRAEAEVQLHQDLDHAILDVASALEIFIDQIIEEDIHYALDPKVVRKLRRKGIYSAYDEVLRLLGRPSLKDAHVREPPADTPLEFELLEFIFTVRNNVIHRGVRQFTSESLNTRLYRSPYLDRHKRFEGLFLNDPRDVLELVEGARRIILWVRTTGAPRR